MDLIPVPRDMLLQMMQAFLDIHKSTRDNDPERKQIAHDLQQTIQLTLPSCSSQTQVAAVIDTVSIQSTSTPTPTATPTPMPPTAAASATGNLTEAIDVKPIVENNTTITNSPSMEESHPISKTIKKIPPPRGTFTTMTDASIKNKNKQPSVASPIIPSICSDNCTDTLCTRRHPIALCRNINMVTGLCGSRACTFLHMCFSLHTSKDPYCRRLHPCVYGMGCYNATCDRVHICHGNNNDNCVCRLTRQTNIYHRLSSGGSRHISESRSGSKPKAGAAAAGSETAIGSGAGFGAFTRVAKKRALDSNVSSPPAKRVP